MKKKEEKKEKSLSTISDEAKIKFDSYLEAGLSRTEATKLLFKNVAKEVFIELNKKKKNDNKQKEV